MRLRYAMGVLLALTSGTLIIGDAWRFVSPQSCNHHPHLCLTVYPPVTAALLLQFYASLVGAVLSIALICEARSGVRKDARIFGAAILIPGGLADLVLNWLILQHDDKLAQFAKESSLSPKRHRLRHHERAPRHLPAGRVPAGTPEPARASREVVLKRGAGGLTTRTPARKDALANRRVFRILSTKS